MTSNGECRRIYPQRNALWAAQLGACIAEIVKAIIAAVISQSAMEYGHFISIKWTLLGPVLYVIAFGGPMTFVAFRNAIIAEGVQKPDR